MAQSCAVRSHLSRGQGIQVDGWCKLSLLLMDFICLNVAISWPPILSLLSSHPSEQWTRTEAPWLCTRWAMKREAWSSLCR